MWFSPPLFPYTLGFPYLRVHVYVINEKSKFCTKNAQKNEKKETSQIEHLVFRIFVWQFVVHNICKPPYCHMVSALNSLYNQNMFIANIFWLKSTRISYFYQNVELTLNYNDQYFFRKIRDMRPNNDARVDLKRLMIVLTGTRCTYFKFKTTHKTFCMVIYAAIHC